ncbi:MAG: hypothetical protein HY608_00445 [Planctomycetes bacterium]|nr:hypothetical protein [Planctomycetota bacterium]
MPPPVVAYEVQGEGEAPRAGEVVVREADVPLLCGPGGEAAKRHLRLILRARDGDAGADRDLRDARGAGRDVPRAAQATGHVVPSTCAGVVPPESVSQKGATLLELIQQGYPVPDFVIVASEAYAERSERLERDLGDALSCLEGITCQRPGSGGIPLVLAVRCAMPQYTPGIMPTYLNAGVVAPALPALGRAYGEDAARRMFLNNLVNIAEALPGGMTGTPDVPAPISERIERLCRVVRSADPALLEDPFRQILFLARRAYGEYEANLDLLLTLSQGRRYAPALILQKMVCTVRGRDSSAGVLYSRHPTTGEGCHLETARSVFGEDIMTGSAEPAVTDFADPTEIHLEFPAVSHFVSRLPGLERRFASPVTVEFATEAASGQDLFALLQLNRTEMSGRAAYISSVRLYEDGAIPRARALELIQPCHTRQIEDDAIDPDSVRSLESFCGGVPVLPRASVRGRIFFSAEAAREAKSRGDRVCFCKQRFIPTDTVIMRQVDALVSLGPAAIHVNTICQGLGIQALLDLEKEGVVLSPDGRGLVNARGRALPEGEWVTICSWRRTLFVGRARFRPARLLRYLRGDPVELEEVEKPAFKAMAHASTREETSGGMLHSDIRNATWNETRIWLAMIHPRSNRAGRPLARAVPAPVASPFAMRRRERSNLFRRPQSTARQWPCMDVDRRGGRECIFRSGCQVPAFRTSLLVRKGERRWHESWLLRRSSSSSSGVCLSPWRLGDVRGPPAPPVGGERTTATTRLRPLRPTRFNGARIPPRGRRSVRCSRPGPRMPPSPGRILRSTIRTRKTP